MAKNQRYHYDCTIYCLLGKFKKDQKHGHGIWTFADGGVLKGVFESGKFTEGTFISNKNKTEYRGGFKDFKKHGKGRLIYKDGKIYEGNFLEGRFHGFGKLDYGDGKVFEGYWYNGKKHGKGSLSMYKSNGVMTKRKVGRWKFGKRMEWLG